MIVYDHDNGDGRVPGRYGESSLTSSSLSVLWGGLVEEREEWLKIVASEKKS